MHAAIAQRLRRVLQRRSSQRITSTLNHAIHEAGSRLDLSYCRALGPDVRASTGMIAPTGTAIERKRIKRAAFPVPVTCRRLPSCPCSITDHG